MVGGLEGELDSLEWSAEGLYKDCGALAWVWGLIQVMAEPLPF